MGHKLTKEQRKNYFGIIEFNQRFPTEATCEEHLLKLKYPDGFECKRCNCRQFYRLKGTQFKRNRLIQCRTCKKQESLTAQTIFHGSKLSLLKWFYAFFFITQTKKGISANLLSKQIKVAYSTALCMLYKIRREMEENTVKYQIGGPGFIVEADEIEIGGVGSEKQTVLVLLEKKISNNKIGRVRFAPIPDKKTKTIELNLIPQIAKGSILHVDGRKAYLKIQIRNFQNIELNQISHKKENHSHKFLKDLNMIVGNLKTWYRGTHHQFALKNTAYYLNEFAYRFNRRRSEINIFEKLLKRSIVRPKILKLIVFRREKQYLPLAA